MKDFDFITDELLLEKLEQLKKEDPKFYDALVKYVRDYQYLNIGTEYLTSIVNYQLFGE